MKHRILIRNTRTGDLDVKHFSNMDDAFDYYWKLTDEDDPDIEFELITSA